MRWQAPALMLVPLYFLIVEMADVRASSQAASVLECDCWYSP